MSTLPFKVFSGTASRYLAEKICKSLGCELGQVTYQRFSDGEFTVWYDETVRGRYVVPLVRQSDGATPDD